MTSLLSISRSSARCAKTLVLLASLLSPLAVGGMGCGGKTMGLASTDTGNPPVVEAQKIRIMESGTGVTVAGEAGAVSPGGASVDVVNDTTGESARTTAATDGSFTVQIGGTTADSYRITVEADGKSMEVVAGGGTMSPGMSTGGSSGDPMMNAMQPDMISAGGTMNTNMNPNGMDPLRTCIDASGYFVNPDFTSGPEPICGDLLAEAECRAGEVIQTIDNSCTLDADCVQVVGVPSCVELCLTTVTVSTQGAAALGTALDDINGTVCEAFSAEGCSFVNPDPCEPLEPSVTRCMEGVCQQVPDVAGNLPSPGEPCEPAVGCGENVNVVCVADSCEEMGTCMEFGPVACAAIYQPVCGCDGQTYGNECSLRGAPFQYEGECQ